MTYSNDISLDQESLIPDKEKTVSTSTKNTANNTVNNTSNSTGINPVSKTLFSSFYSKLALALIGSFIAIGILLVMFIKQLSQNYQSEIEQKLHLDLASHLVYDSPQMKSGEFDHSSLKDTFHTMMILGPSFEFYLLDPQGKVLTYDAEPGKVKREYIDLEPINAFLNKSESLPIWGADPRHDNRKKIFSVAEIKNDDGLQGYLYIIIGGELYDGVVDLMQNSHIATIGLWLVSAAIIFSMLVTLLLFGFLTRPLRKLSQEMTLFSQEGFEHGNQADRTSPLAKWNSSSSDEVERLGATFHQMSNTLNDQYTKIKTTDQVRRELISYVSHDLRTPLASLQGYLETWQLSHKTMDPIDAKSLIDVAEKNAKQVSRLVEQLFELAHLDSNTLELEKEPVPIAELAYDVLQKMTLDANKKGVELYVEIEDSSLKVMANIERLERVFTNLIDNAIRHCSEGHSVTIEINAQVHNACALEEVHQSGASRVLVNVRDTGVGIPKEDLEFIFDTHYRATNSIAGKRSGSGLGLAITRRVLDLHGSQIQVESTLGEGTCFMFCLEQYKVPS